MKLLVVIVNHALQSEAIALKNRFKQALAGDAGAKVIAIDSGSKLSQTERNDFDLCLANVYYSGLFNAAIEQSKGQHDDSVLLFVCSDVRIADVDALLARVRATFSLPSVGIYAPSVAESQGMRSTVHLGQGGLRQALFAEGFCFAARLHLFRRLGLIDTSVNLLGWGIDVELGRLASALNLSCYVDDDIVVSHSPGSGYDDSEALRQWLVWVAKRSIKTRLYHRAVDWKRAMTPVGIRIVRALTALLGP